MRNAIQNAARYSLMVVMIIKLIPQSMPNNVLLPLKSFSPCSSTKSASLSVAARSVE